MDWLDAAIAAYGIYNNNKSPKFKDPGLTPEQSQLYNLYFGSLTNPELKDSASWASQSNKSILSGYMTNPPTWTPAKTYGPQAGFSWGGNQPNRTDTKPWAPTPTPTTTTPNNPAAGGGGSKDMAPDVTAPYGTGGNDPFSFMDGFDTTTGGGNTGGGMNYEGIGRYLQQHPNILKGVGVLGSIAGVPAAMLGAWFANMWLNRKYGGDNQPNQMFGEGTSNPSLYGGGYDNGPNWGGLPPYGGMGNSNGYTDPRNISGPITHDVGPSSPIGGGNSPYREDWSGSWADNANADWRAAWDAALANGTGMYGGGGAGGFDPFVDASAIGVRKPKAR